MIRPGKPLRLLFLGLSASLLLIHSGTAEAGLFNKKREVIVVPSTTYVVADPYVVTSRTVVVPTETVFAVPTRRVYAAPATVVDRAVVRTSREVYVAPAEEVYVVPTRRVYAAPSIAVPVLRETRVLVPGTVVEVYP